MPDNPMGMFSGVAEAIVWFFKMLWEVIDFFLQRPKVLFWSILGFVIWGAIIHSKHTWLLIAGIFLIVFGASLRRVDY